MALEGQEDENSTDSAPWEQPSEPVSDPQRQAGDGWTDHRSTPVLWQAMESARIGILYSSGSHADIEAAAMMAGYSDFNHPHSAPICRGWGSSGLDSDEVKVASLVEQIEGMKLNEIAIFAYFSDSYQLKPFLAHWGIELGEKPPSLDGWACLIDTEFRTIKFVPAPFHDLERRKEQE